MTKSDAHHAIETISMMSEAIGRHLQTVAALESNVLTLRAALERIATGQEMTGIYSLADVVHTYQRIAMDAIAKTEG